MGDILKDVRIRWEIRSEKVGSITKTLGFFIETTQRGTLVCTGFAELKVLHTDKVYLYQSQNFDSCLRKYKGFFVGAHLEELPELPVNSNN